MYRNVLENGSACALPTVCIVVLTDTRWIHKLVTDHHEHLTNPGLVR